MILNEITAFTKTRLSFTLKKCDEFLKKNFKSELNEEVDIFKENMLRDIGEMSHVNDEHIRKQMEDDINQSMIDIYELIERETKRLDSK